MTTTYARVEQYGWTSVVELIIADIAVKSFDIADKPRADLLAQKINDRLNAGWPNRKP